MLQSPGVRFVAFQTRRARPSDKSEGQQLLNLGQVSCVQVFAFNFLYERTRKNSGKPCRTQSASRRAEPEGTGNTENDGKGGRPGRAGVLRTYVVCGNRNLIFECPHNSCRLDGATNQELRQIEPYQAPSRRAASRYDKRLSARTGKNESRRLTADNETGWSRRVLR